MLETIGFCSWVILLYYVCTAVDYAASHFRLQLLFCKNLTSVHINMLVILLKVAGIRFMWENIIQSIRNVKAGDKGLGCILAHTMGLGKTFQVSSFVNLSLSSVLTHGFFLVGNSGLFSCKIPGLFAWLSFEEIKIRRGLCILTLAFLFSGDSFLVHCDEKC